MKLTGSCCIRTSCSGPARRSCPRRRPAPWGRHATSPALSFPSRSAAHSSAPSVDRNSPPGISRSLYQPRYPPEHPGRPPHRRRPRLKRTPLHGMISSCCAPHHLVGLLSLEASMRSWWRRSSLTPPRLTVASRALGRLPLALSSLPQQSTVSDQD